LVEKNSETIREDDTLSGLCLTTPPSRPSEKVAVQSTPLKRDEMHPNLLKKLNA